MARFYCPQALHTSACIELPATAARHVQVLRMQPSQTITLFNGAGGEFEAVIEHMGRQDVRVLVGAHHTIEREASHQVHLAVVMPANDRMDWLVEKATELGAFSLLPITAERSVLKLKGERSDKKLAHWQAIAVAASEQCGRNRVPVVHNAVDLAGWVRAQAQATTVQRLLLSLRAGTLPLQQAAAPAGPVLFLSGPEGGLSSAEEDLALLHGFAPVTLGPRVLRAETAPLAALAALTLL